MPNPNLHHDDDYTIEDYHHNFYQSCYIYIHNTFDFSKGLVQISMLVICIYDGPNFNHHGTEYYE